MLASAKHCDGQVELRAFSFVWQNNTIVGDVKDRVGWGA